MGTDRADNAIPEKPFILYSYYTTGFAILAHCPVILTRLLQWLDKEYPPPNLYRRSGSHAWAPVFTGSASDTDNAKEL
jgi:hypothetical protein